MFIDNIMNQVYCQTRAVFTNVIDDSMNHVYCQTIGVFTNVIDKIMNHVYWKNNSGIYQCH